DDCFTNYYPDNVVENNENDIMIYPNPATTNVEVSYTLPEGKTNATLVMTNTLGVNVMTAQLDGNNKTTLSLEELPSGIYFYTIRCGEDVKTGKLVKRN
ncbi:MAG: T9SS type A sorting domain-containing protein, partial [Bacteroidales bacterium]|nr:T9SS type A sorting domain-containing protein [Bacteroidales bacterium]